MPSRSVFSPQFFVSDEDHVAKCGKESPHLARKLEIVPQSAEGADVEDVTSSEWVKSCSWTKKKRAWETLYSCFTCCDDCMFLPCCWDVQKHSDWVRQLRHTFDWPVRYTLYVTMSQASSGPAEHDLMDPSNPRLRDPYITCCYRRHNPPHQPQHLWHLLFHFTRGLSRLGKSCLYTFSLVFSWSESNEITVDLFYKTSWL